MKLAKRVVVKIGSAILLNGKTALDPKMFANLANQIATLHKKGYELVIVSSGAIAAGMTRLGIKKRPETISQKQALAAAGQTQLMHFYEKAFAKHKLKVAQLLLTRDDLTHRTRYLNAHHTVEALLEMQIIPIINENDSVAVEEIKFGDNDQLAALATNFVNADLMIILSDIDGVFDKDPKKYKDAKLLPVIDKIDDWVRNFGGDTQTQTSTGGMKTKLLAAEMVAHFGVPTIIANGATKNILVALLEGKPAGTKILPREIGSQLSSRKHCIVYT